MTSTVWHRFYLDAGLLFWEGGSAPDADDDLGSGEKYLDLAAELRVVGASVHEIEMHDCVLKLTFDNGAHLRLSNEVRGDAGARVVESVSGRPAQSQ